MVNNFSLALALGRRAWDGYRDFRHRKEEEAYEALERAAAGADSLAEDAKRKGKEVSRDADEVLRKARRRFEKAREEADGTVKDLTAHAAEAQEQALKKGRRVSRRTRRKALAAGAVAARKAQGKYEKAADRARAKVERAEERARRKAEARAKRRRARERRRKLGRLAKVLALLGAVAGVAVFVLGLGGKRGKRDETADQPPHVDEYSRDGDRLVWTSRTPAGADTDAGADDSADVGTPDPQPVTAEEGEEIVDPGLRTPEERTTIAAAEAAGEIREDDSEGRHRLREEPTGAPEHLPETTAREITHEHDEVEINAENPDRGPADDDEEGGSHRA